MSFRDNIKKVTPYVPGEQPNFDDMIKLNTNENPYPPSPEVARALKDINADELKMYPPLGTTRLETSLLARFGRKEGEIFVGVGSDDVLAVAFMTFFNSDKPILFPDITYSFYDVWAKLYKIPYKTIPLDENFRINREDYKVENGGIVIANPNAPTSLCEDLDFIEYVIENNRDSIVIIDEAYVDFGGTSAAALLDKYENLLVVQTFSKSRSLAGLRIGYALGSKELISAMNAVKFSINSYTMNRPSTEIGVKSVEDEEYFKKTIEKIIRTREETAQKLRELGFKVLNSKANFLFVSHADVSAKHIYEELRKSRIFVRYFDKPRIDNFLRVTVGTDAQMNIFVETVSRIVGKSQ